MTVVIEVADRDGGRVRSDWIVDGGRERSGAIADQHAHGARLAVRDREIGLAVVVEVADPDPGWMRAELKSSRRSIGACVGRRYWLCGVGRRVVAWIAIAVAGLRAIVETESTACANYDQRRPSRRAEHASIVHRSGDESRRRSL